MNFRKAIRGPAITLVTLVVLLILAEVLVRLFTDIHPSLTVRNPKLGNTYRPNFNGRVYGPESKEYVDIRINRDGFRGQNRPYDKNNRTVRIAIMGDSMIAAINTRESDTLVVKLEKMLNGGDFPGVSFEVFNFGVSGASTAQEYNLYKEVVRQYDVDLVVCAYYNGNDFSDNCSRLSWNPRVYMDFDDEEQLRTKYPPKGRSGASKWLNTYSRFYIWQKIAVNNAIENIRSSGYAGADNRISGGWLVFVDNPSDEDLAYAWKLNAKIIHEFYSFVTSENVSFLFVAVPDAIELYDERWEMLQELGRGSVYESHLDRKLPERQLKEIVSGKGIPSLFLSDGFGKHIRERKEEGREYWLGYGSGSGHLNEEGNAVAAELIFDYLAEQPWFRTLIESRSARPSSM